MLPTGRARNALLTTCHALNAGLALLVTAAFSVVVDGRRGARSA